MAMEINGAAVLAAIVESPASFSLSGAQINALAMSTLIGCLKDKSLVLETVRSIARTIGQNDFRLVLDHLAPKDVAALAKRLDSKNPDVRVATDTWHRDQISKLADGRLEPVVVSPRVPARRASPPKETGSKTGEVMKSKALKSKAVPRSATPRAKAKKA